MSNTNESDTLTAQALVALKAAVEAGAEILGVYSGEFEVQHKADRSPLTEADLRAQRRIHAILEEHDPEIPFLGEEAADIPYDRRELWDRYWLVDPLDGTKEFVKRNGEFTVNIAYVSAAAGSAGDGPHEPLVGVVYAPVLARAYVGVVGAGAYRIDNLETGARIPLTWDELTATGRRLPTGPTGPAGPADEAAPRAPGAPNRPAALRERPFTVVASRSHMTPETETFVEELREEHPDLQLVSAGSALKMCLVAEGAADVYPRFAPTMEWDTAAGHAVCLAAGVEVNAWPAERPLTYNKPELVNSWFLVRRRAATELPDVR